MGACRWIKAFRQVFFMVDLRKKQIVADPTLLYDENILIQILQTNTLNPWDSTLYVRTIILVQTTSNLRL